MRHSERRVWWKRKLVVIPLILGVLLVEVRLVLEPVLLSVVNRQAKTVNPVFEGHVGDLDLAILRGGLLLEDVTATIKDNGREFFHVEDVLVDLSWRDLFTGDLRFDVAVNAFTLTAKKDLLAAVEKLPKPDEPKKALPFELSKIRVTDSVIALPEYPGLRGQEHLKVTAINGAVTGISGEPRSALGKFAFTAGLAERDDVELTGNVDLSATPPRWDANARIRKFELATGNKLLAALVPMNFKKGTLDLYAEAKSEDGKIFGYVKPFLNDVEFMGNRNEFKGGKHFFVELAGAVSNFVFENSDRKSVATRVPFIFEDGAFSVEGGGALVEAVQHGLLENERVPRGIEQKYRLNRPDPAGAQAHEDDLRRSKQKKSEK
jgi:hypothetical protein